MAISDYDWDEIIRDEQPDRCLYCGHILPQEEADALGNYPVPDIDNEVGWQRIADQHNADCQWYASRAHRYFAAQPIL